MIRPHLFEALAVVLPLDCAACGVPAPAVLCGGCSAELRDEAHCRARLLGPASDPLVVITGGDYAGTLRRLLLALKEEGRVGAATPLAALLRPALRTALGDAPAALIAPPGSWPRHVRRGYDPVHLLVRAAGGRVESPLRRVRIARDQVGLSRVDRRGNLDGAFRARRAPAGPLVLVDDVVTSGATLLEMRRAVETAGGRVRAAVALAGTALRAGEGLPGDSPEVLMHLRMNSR